MHMRDRLKATDAMLAHSVLSVIRLNSASGITISQIANNMRITGDRVEPTVLALFDGKKINASRDPFRKEKLYYAAI